MYDSKFDKFDISEVTYKVFNNQPIHAYVLSPKTLPAGAQAPLLANFHEGFNVTGAAMDPDLNPHLETVKSDVSGDLDKIIVWGGSAGGYLTIQSGFLQPASTIKALIACYPGLGLECKYEKHLKGLSTIPPNVLQDYLKTMKPGTIVTSAFPPARLDIAPSISQQGLKKQFLGTDDSLFPFKILEKKYNLPNTLILHGTEDSVVWLSGNEQFAEAVRNKFEKKINLVTQPGEHGFDEQITLDMPWLKEALNPVTKLWLGETTV